MDTSPPDAYPSNWNNACKDICPYNTGTAGFSATAASTMSFYRTYFHFGQRV